METKLLSGAEKNSEGDMEKNELESLESRPERRNILKSAARMVVRNIGEVTMVAFAILVMAGNAYGQDWGKPVWSDEFNSSVPGAPPDASSWTFEIGGNGWGNHELEIYCPAGTVVSVTATTATAPPPVCNAEHPNAFQDGQGHLIIRAWRVSAEPKPTGTWTSARMKSIGLREFQYGRTEACMKLPVGAGMWPAFWMMGTGAKWPTGGEIDIMENIPAAGGSESGLGPTKVEGTIHGPSTLARGHFSLTQVYALPDGQRVDDATPSCHVYGAIWSPFMIQMYVDDWRKPYFIRTTADVPADGRWVFNAPFYFLLNLAVGGDWPGPPDIATPSPADVLVDYVRVYKSSRVDAPVMRAGALKSIDGIASTVLSMTSRMRGGYVYVGCASDGAVCSVHTGNALNASVADFGAGETQTAKITVKNAVNSRVTVTAYTVSGEESSLVIPVE
jgi:beta-glucanase (GH16 family)